MDNNRPNIKKSVKFSVIAFIIIVILIIITISDYAENGFGTNLINSNLLNQGNEFKIIASSENEDLENILQKFAKQEGIDLVVEYAGTLDIMEKLNSGDEYDAVWISNSIWVYMLDDSVKISNSKSTSINPVVFGVTESKAEELGFVGKDIYTQDIVDTIKSGNLKFSMSNPTQTNTGATAYLGLLATLAENPEVLREEHLQSEELKTELVSLFSGLERSSGSEDFLEELFLNGSYEAVVTYESSIINMNKQLESQGKETLYVLYPVDGVSISDSPFAYIDNKNEEKEEIFSKIQSYILSDEGQSKLAETGRRTWYGGISNNIDETVFNPDWGIDTGKYITPIKFPNAEIIKQALNLYQTELRKPIHTVFCLDYSGSMSGDGYSQLTGAMEYILTEEQASKDLLQFADKDKITVIPFSGKVLNIWNTDNGLKTEELLNNISTLQPSGSTNIYDTCIQALAILKDEDLKDEDFENYNVSVVLMTDGMSNVGSMSNLKSYYNAIKIDIPIYSIMFGSAYEDELEDIASFTNAKVFDGRTDLLKAFKQVRGYN